MKVTASSRATWGELNLEDKGGYVIWLGHVGGLEDDEEGLVDVLVKLETSYDRIAICRLPEPVNFSYARNVVHRDIGKRDQGYKIVATGQQSAVLSERISELEQDNMRLRGTLDVANQRVSQLQRRELHIRREMWQIQRFRFYDCMRIAWLEAYARRHLGYHP
ncbi:hypothetical protein Tco_1192485 [Tanacetum coccineum]